MGKNRNMTVTMIERFEAMIDDCLKPLRAYVEAEREKVRGRAIKLAEKETGINKLNDQKKVAEEKLEAIKKKIDVITSPPDGGRWYAPIGSSEYPTSSLIGRMIEARLSCYGGIIKEFDDLSTSFKTRLWTSEAPSAVGELLEELRGKVTALNRTIKQEAKLAKKDATRT